MPQTWRLDLNCTELGVRPPPFPLSLEPTPSGLMARGPPGRMDLAGNWLGEQFGALLPPRPASFGASNVHLAHPRWPQGFEEVPGWTKVVLGPEGTATVFMAASERPQPAGRPLAGDPMDRMTPRQLQAIRLAVWMGYYDVPRRADLRALAARMGISHGSLSELLRRGESSVMRSFCDQAMMAGASTIS
jgi:hypothetical protein